MTLVYSRPGAEKNYKVGMEMGDNIVAMQHNPNKDKDNNKHRSDDDDEEENDWYEYEPYAICQFIPLIDSNGIVGYTQFWPGSHNNAGLIGFGPVVEITQPTWPPPPTARPSSLSTQRQRQEEESDDGDKGDAQKKCHAGKLFL